MPLRPRSRPAQGRPGACPSLTGRSGVWRFDARKVGQAFSAGEQIATGLRDIGSMDWRAVALLRYRQSVLRVIAAAAVLGFLARLTAL